MSISLARTVAVSITASIALIGLTPVAQASSVWDRVAACESGGNWAISTDNGFYGGLQFTHQTWIGYGGGAYGSNANAASRSAQILVAQRVLRGQGPGAWPVCSQHAGLTRGNGAGVITVSRSGIRPAIHRAPAKLVIDGIIGPLTRGSLARHGIHLSNRHVVAAWQARLRLPKTGVLDMRTVKSLQRWLNTHKATR